MISVYHRAGWSIGNVQQRYIFPTEGGDQMVGQILCGGEWNSDVFAVLPPHFVERTITHEQWRTMNTIQHALMLRFLILWPVSCFMKSGYERSEHPFTSSVASIPDYKIVCPWKRCPLPLLMA